MAAAEEEPPPGEEDPRREQRYMMIKSLERDKPEFDARNFWPDDLYDFAVWQTDDEVVDFFDSEGRIRPAPAGIDRDGGGDFWDCKVCEDKTNRDPADRQLWVGARVEASAPGERVFYEATVVRIREPKPDAFGELPPDARVMFDVRFDDGKRVTCDRQRVRIPAKCKTCGRPRGRVPMWMKGNDFMKAVKTGNLPIVAQLSEAGVDLEQEDLVGNTPLMLAASGGKANIVRYLLSLAVSTTHTNQEKATALSLAARKGHAGCVAALLDADPSQVAVPEGLGRTPILLAAAGGHEECLRLLCQQETELHRGGGGGGGGGRGGSSSSGSSGSGGSRGSGSSGGGGSRGGSSSSVNIPDHQGLTPFFKAASSNHVGCMKVLVDYGARRESLAQSMVLTRDRRLSSVIEQGFYEITPDGHDARMSGALKTRYRMV